MAFSIAFEEKPLCYPYDDRTTPAEYDLSYLKNEIRGKYAARYRAGTNLVLLSSDGAAYFPDEQSVDAALRTLIRVAKGPLPRARR
jgi:hypothetical protein